MPLVSQDFYQTYDLGLSVIDSSNSAGPGLSNTNSVAITSDGTLHHVAVKRVSSLYYIYYYYSTDGGATWSSGQEVDSTTVSSSSYPGICATSDDTLHIFWWNSSHDQLNYAYGPGQGAAWTVSTNIATNFGTDSYFTVVVDFDDVIHLIWEHNVDLYHLYGSGKGAAWTEETLSTTYSDPSYPTAYVDGDGVVNVTWVDYNFSDGRYEIFYGSFQGGSWTNHGSVFGTLDFQKSNYVSPQIVIGTDDEVHIIAQTSSDAMQYAHAPKYTSGPSFTVVGSFDTGGSSWSNCVPYIVSGYNGEDYLFIFYDDNTNADVRCIYGATKQVASTSRFVVASISAAKTSGHQRTREAFRGSFLDLVVDTSGSYVYFTRLNAEQILLTAPKGGESLTVGNSYNITWDNSIEGTDHIHLKYSTDGGTTYPNDITASTPDTGSYSWIPSSASTQYRVQIIAEDASNTALASMESGTFEVTGAGASVSQDKAFSYDIANTTDQSLSYTYDLENLASQGISFSYDLVGQVSQNFFFEYTIVGLTSQDLSYGYTLGNTLAQELSFSYDLAEQISQSLLFEYSVIAFVGQDQFYVYVLGNTLARDLVYTYSVIEQISRSLPFEYHVVVFIEQDQFYVYAVRNELPQNLVYAYDLISYVSLTLSYSYDLINFVSRTFSLTYNILNTITVDLLYTYTVYRSVTASLSFSYSVLSGAAATLSFAYNILVSSDLTLSYELRSTVFATLTFIYSTESLVEHFAREWTDTRLQQFTELRATDYGFSPSVASFQGRFALVFTRDHAIYLRSFSQGDSWSDPQLLFTQSAHPSIFADEEGTFHLVYEYSSSGNSQVMYTKADFGLVWETPTVLATNAGAPAVASKEDQIFVAMATPDEIVLWRKSSPWTSIPVATASQASQVAIALGGQERVYVAWVVDRQGFISRSDDNGTTWSTPLSLGEADWISLSELKTEHLLIVYEVGLRLKGVVSRDFGDSLDDVWDIVRPRLAAMPTLLVDNTGKNTDVIVVSSDVLQGFLLTRKTLPFFAYLSEYLDVGSLRSLFHSENIDFTPIVDWVFWGPEAYARYDIRIGTTETFDPSSWSAWVETKNNEPPTSIPELEG